MIKEKIRAILYRNNKEEAADQILGLMGEELDKLTVIGDEELRLETGLSFGTKAQKDINRVLQAQLNHTISQLKKEFGLGTVPERRQG